MHVIHARNVNDAWPQAISLLQAEGVPSASRNGPVRVLPCPVTIAYSHPCERVLFDPHRDHNPLFALFEALWMIAGRNDAKWLDQFVGDFSARFAEPSGRMHGAYGKRWRAHFDGTLHPSNDTPHWVYLDQLNEVVRLLCVNPDDRQAVISMWDPGVDLGIPGLKDRPCNTHIYLRVRGYRPTGAGANFPVLDITVCNRSNDLVYGALGANVVHMSMLQEYLAARIGVGVGTYYQMSNSHLYDDTLNRVDLNSADENALPPYPGIFPLVDDPDSFDDELHAYLARPTDPSRERRNHFFNRVAMPMMLAHEARKRKDYTTALQWCEHIEAPDWALAAYGWLERRMK